MPPARADPFLPPEQAYRRTPRETLLTRVEHTQPAVGPFFGKFPKMPVCHAAIDKLRIAGNPFLVTSPMFPKITPVHCAYGFQTFILHQRPEKVPRQDYPVNEGFDDLALFGFSDNRRPPLPELRIFIDFEVSF